METKIEGHHFVIAILTVFVGIQLWQLNFLGIPQLVGNLVRTVVGAVQPIAGNINIGSLAGTGQ